MPIGADKYNIISEVVPAWYELGFDNDANAVTIAICPALKQLILDPEHIKQLAVGRLIVKDRNGEVQYQLADFNSSDTEWGFGGIGRWINNPNHWPTLLCPLPVICDNQGQIDTVKGCAVSATLGVMFDLLYLIPDSIPESGRNQLIFIEYLLSALADLYGGALGVIITPQMVRWMRTQPDTHNNLLISESMQKAAKFMWSDTRKSTLNDAMYYSARFSQKKWVNLDIPGDACGLDPEDYYDGESQRGYVLVPHNTDSHYQQLTLLVGLAELHQLARQDGF